MQEVLALFGLIVFCVLVVLACGYAAWWFSRANDAIRFVRRTWCVKPYPAANHREWMNMDSARVERRGWERHVDNQFGATAELIRRTRERLDALEAKQAKKKSKYVKLG